jgi:TRAP-type C4-dicarboxylate transport system substrate-binding protein
VYLYVLRFIRIGGIIMRKISHLVLVGIICLSLTMAIIPVMNAHAKGTGKVYEWRFFVSYPPAMFPIMPSYPEMIRKATNGQLDIKLFFFGEHPYKGSEIMAAIRDQRCQMGEIEAAYYAGSEPVLSLTGGPLLATTAKVMFEMHEALLHAGILDSIYKKYNMFEVAYWTWWGPSISCADTLVTKIDSLKGKKIRVPTKQYADMISWLGGTPVTISWGEVYTALQRGIMDGATGALCAQRDSKWPEVCKYYTRWAQAFGIDRVGVNKDAFEELPADVQKVFLKVTRDFEKMQRERIERDDALATVDVIDRNGVTVTAMPPDVLNKLTERTPSYLKEWAESAGKGLPEALSVVNKVRGW